MAKQIVLNEINHKVKSDNLSILLLYIISKIYLKIIQLIY